MKLIQIEVISIKSIKSIKKIIFIIYVVIMTSQLLDLLNIRAKICNVVSQEQCYLQNLFIHRWKAYEIDLYGFEIWNEYERETFVLSYTKVENERIKIRRDWSKNFNSLKKTYFYRKCINMINLVKFHENICIFEDFAAT